MPRLRPFHNRSNNLTLVSFSEFFESLTHLLITTYCAGPDDMRKPLEDGRISISL
jgi:hypothetical protein